MVVRSPPAQWGKHSAYHHWLRISVYLHSSLMIIYLDIDGPGYPELSRTPPNILDITRQAPEISIRYVGPIDLGSNLISLDN
jgi:hypothetical protein